MITVVRDYGCLLHGGLIAVVLYFFLLEVWPRHIVLDMYPVYYYFPGAEIHRVKYVYGTRA